MSEAAVEGKSSLGHAPGARWEFDESVTSAFDDMLRRSIPQYEAMRDHALSECAKKMIVVHRGWIQSSFIEGWLQATQVNTLVPSLATALLAKCEECERLRARLDFIANHH